MNLVVQLAVCAGAVALAAVLLRGELSRSTMAGTTAVCAGLVVALLGFQGLYAAAKGHVANAKAQRDLPNSQVLSGATSAIGVDGAFIEWAVKRMGDHDSYFIASPKPEATQWLGYRALPRLAAARLQDAKWVVFYDATPQQAGYRPQQFASFAQYKARYSIARMPAKLAP